MLTSCDMDFNEPGTINDVESLKTIEDCRAYRNNVYSSFRALTSGTYVYNSELEMDQFLGMFANGNRGLYFSNANITSNYSDVNSIYNGIYGSMKNVNFFLQHGQEIYDSGSLSEDDALELKRYIGEVKFFRAYFYFYLFDHFCQSYDASKAGQPGLGCQLVTVYEPTGDTSKYPGRSSMDETLKLINDDLADAFSCLEEYQADGQDASSIIKANSSYLSTYAIAALQARVALVTSQYQTAIDKANYVIGNSAYSLTSGDDYVNMWFDDNGTELIFVPFVSAAESGYIGSTNDGWNYYANYPGRIDYAPTYGTVAAYADNDVRKNAFFYYGEDMVFGDLGATSCYVFAKFPGNDALISGTNMYKNKPKPFRLSEQYLIIAEASSLLSKDADANDALETLRKARIENYVHTDLNGNALNSQIRLERAKELIGEGFRMSDLRRWGVGFTRDASYPVNPEVTDFFIPSTVSVSFEPNDYRYVWPIPYDEMQVNPQLAGQQNPGY